MTTVASDNAPPRHGLPYMEFVGIIAGLMAVNALGVDIMLPALSTIGRDLHLSVVNHQQWVISVYLASFGVGQLFFGPLADRFGRRPILLGALSLYAAMSVLAALANSFELLLAARALQGFASASTRVLTISIVRDCYSGRTMARVMSMAFTVFLFVPILAPALGQMILLVAPWHWIFYVLGAFSLSIALWAEIRLPETLDFANRRPINPAAILQSAWIVLTNRYSLGYTLAMANVYGGMVGFLSSAQQIIADGFGVPELFALCFASVGISMGAASLLNARIVERLGSRLVSHTALIAMIAINGLHMLVLVSGHETLAAFLILQGLSMFCFGFCGSNFGAMAMEEMGQLAGTASAVQGFISTSGGSVIGLIIGQHFTHDPLPLAIGIFTASCTALLIIFITERGRLMRPHHPVQ